MLAEDLKELIEHLDTTAARDFAIALCNKIDELLKTDTVVSQNVNELQDTVSEIEDIVTRPKT